jgi:methyl-accepting chemotaxis protein
MRKTKRNTRVRKPDLSFFRNRRLSHKIVFLVVIMALFLAGVGSISQVFLAKANQRIGSIYEDNLLPVRYLGELRVLLKANENLILKLATTTTDWRQREIKGQLPGVDSHTNELFQAYQELKLSEEQIQQLNVIRKIYDLFLKQREQIILLAESGDHERAYQAYMDIVPQLDALHNSLDTLAGLHENAAEKLQSQNVEESRKAVMLNLLVIVVGVAIMLALGLFMAKLLSAPLVQMVGQVDKVAQGNLVFEISGTMAKDEIGKLQASIHEMVLNLRKLIHGVTETSTDLSRASKELATAAERTSEAASRIAGAVSEVAAGSQIQLHEAEETTRAIKEMAKGAERIAEFSSVVTEKSANMQDEAFKGNQMAAQVELQMRSIRERVESLRAVTRQLEDRSNNIGRITELMKEMARQTHLLSLNASIEAARAGHVGSGFAVVAEEVRKLAVESQRSAKQIADMIVQIEEQVHESLAATEAVAREVTAGAHIVGEANQAFERLHRFSREMTAQIQEVSAAIQQLAAGSEQVLLSVEKVILQAQISEERSRGIDQSSQDQLEMMRGVLSAAASLDATVNRLEQAVERFRL